MTHGQTAWTSIGSPTTVLAMDLHGNVVADFPGYGVQIHTTQWTVQTPADAYLFATSQS